MKKLFLIITLALTISSSFFQEAESQVKYQSFDLTTAGANDTAKVLDAYKYRDYYVALKNADNDSASAFRIEAVTLGGKRVLISAIDMSGSDHAALVSAISLNAGVTKLYRIATENVYRIDIIKNNTTAASSCEFYALELQE